MTQMETVFLETAASIVRTDMAKANDVLVVFHKPKDIGDYLAQANRNCFKPLSIQARISLENPHEMARALIRRLKDQFPAEIGTFVVHQGPDIHYHQEPFEFGGWKAQIAGFLVPRKKAVT